MGRGRRPATAGGLGDRDRRGDGQAGRVQDLESVLFDPTAGCRRLGEGDQPLLQRRCGRDQPRPSVRRRARAHAPGIDCWEPDPATVQDIVSRWVAVQAAIAHDDLRVPKLLPADLPAELDRLLAGEVGERLTPTELAQARILGDLLPGLIAELNAAGLPNTLVHGDFHPGNWRSDGTNRVIVDWADSYLGHPAADLQRLVNWLPPEKRPLATETWATAWQTALPSSDPLRALKPMTVLIHLLGATTYQRFLDNIEPNERIYHEDDPTNEVRAAVLAAADTGH
ncbi:aminoglycoside phosphotransferase family protein [Kribbella sp. NPDC051718]|uniref:aminoglycoside phosphotransferase family protein n=1 Tax=Kribbella sp. NPDC051718 TaxID=3155168 RepID=UPI0034219CC0